MHSDTPSLVPSSDDNSLLALIAVLVIIKFK